MAVASTKYPAHREQTIWGLIPLIAMCTTCNNKHSVLILTYNYLQCHLQIPYWYFGSH